MILEYILDGVGLIGMMIGLWGIFARDHGFIPVADKYDSVYLIIMLIGIALLASSSTIITWGIWR